MERIKHADRLLGLKGKFSDLVSYFQKVGRKKEKENDSNRCNTS